MQVTTIKGNKKFWDLRPSKYKPKENASSIHVLARKVIHEVFPLDTLLEEVIIPETKLKADFYLPNRKIMIEVQGEQHFEFIQHFHQHKSNFVNSLKRDDFKKIFCDINNIILLELNYDRTEEWGKQLREIFR